MQRSKKTTIKNQEDMRDISYKREYTRKRSTTKRPQNMKDTSVDILHYKALLLVETRGRTTK